MQQPGIVSDGFHTVFGSFSNSVRIVFRLFRSVFELFSRNSSHFQTVLHLHAPIVTDAHQLLSNVQFQGSATRWEVKRRVLSVPVFWTFGIFFWIVLRLFRNVFEPFSDCFPNIFGIILDSRKISHENLLLTFSMKTYNVFNLFRIVFGLL